MDPITTKLIGFLHSMCSHIVIVYERKFLYLFFQRWNPIPSINQWEINYFVGICNHYEFLRIKWRKFISNTQYNFLKSKNFIIGICYSIDYGVTPNSMSFCLIKKSIEHGCRYNIQIEIKYSIWRISNFQVGAQTRLNKLHFVFNWFNFKKNPFYDNISKSKYTVRSCQNIWHYDLFSTIHLELDPYKKLKNSLNDLIWWSGTSFNPVLAK